MRLSEKSTSLYMISLEAAPSVTYYPGIEQKTLPLPRNSS